MSLIFALVTYHRCLTLILIDFQPAGSHLLAWGHLDAGEESAALTEQTTRGAQWGMKCYVLCSLALQNTKFLTILKD